MIVTLLELSKVVNFFTQEDPLDKREEFYNADDKGQDWSSGKYFFDASDGPNLAESNYWPPEATEFDGPTKSSWSSKRKCFPDSSLNKHKARLCKHDAIGTPVAQVLVTALTTAVEDQFGNNHMLTFDTDSSFWVCNSSATGNICNDIKHFHGKLVPSIYSVSATTGTSSPDLMGTIFLCFTDDKGIQHMVTLK